MAKFEEIPLDLEPSRTIPVKLLDGYSMNNQIMIEMKYRDDSSLNVQRMINSKFTEQEFKRNLKRIERRDTNYYGKTDTWMYQALFDHPIEGKDVVIVGSTAPWYEAMALSFGAKSITVFEYSERPSFHEKIEYKRPNECVDKKFDICFNISSIEHDGLGRYGDPLDPRGDLKTMLEYKNILKEDGLMFLAVPVGEDRVYYNVHRIYGNIRFPLLVEKWTPISYYGFFPGCFESNYNNADATSYQPVVVLKNRGKEDGNT